MGRERQRDIERNAERERESWLSGCPAIQLSVSNQRPAIVLLGGASSVAVVASGDPQQQGALLDVTSRHTCSVFGCVCVWQETTGGTCFVLLYAVHDRSTRTIHSATLFVSRPMTLALSGCERTTRNNCVRGKKCEFDCKGWITHWKSSLPWM